MAPRINKDTRLCISLSGRPSNIGTRFHNYLYDELGLDYVYKAFAPTDIEAAVTGIRGLGIRGAGVSMPFKEKVIPLVDVMHESARAIDSVNTIVNEDGVLHAYNTDFQAVLDLPQPTVSRHLQVLRKAELVLDTQIAQYLLYRLRRGSGASGRLLSAILDAMSTEERLRSEREREVERSRTHTESRVRTA